MDSDPTSSGERAFDAATLDLSGRCVGNSYILVRPIGQGATGTVWRGVDRATGEQVAVKLLHESLLRQPKLVTRFVQERTILLMLRHRNVVRVRDLFSAGESLGLVMDLVGGGSLRGYLRTHRALPAATVARIGGQVAAALAEAHSLGIVHRDLKPDNILVENADDVPDVRLTDFGIARVLSTPGITTPHAVVGTPIYMAPEAFQGVPTEPAVDVYALGIVLHELLVGKPPYVEDSLAELMRRHLEDRPVRPDDVPDDLWTLILSCLHADPTCRPEAAELVARLAAIAREDPPAPPPRRPLTGRRTGPVECADLAAFASPPALPSLPSLPALPAPEPQPHPSLPGSVRLPPQRRNQVPGWRWARPWLFVVLICAAMLVSGAGVRMWHVHQAAGAASAPVSPPSGPPAGSAQPVATGSAPALAPSRAGSVRADLPVPSATPQPGAARSEPGESGESGEPGGGQGGGPSTEPPAEPPAEPRPRPRTEARPYGPYECRELVQFTSGYPLLAKPCHSIGAAVRVTARMAAAPGTRARVSLSLHDLDQDRTVAGPLTCGTLEFRDGAMSQSCGPLEFRPTPGRRYAVVQTWEYVEEGRTTQGTARGPEFSY